MKFTEHGVFEIVVEGSFLLVDATGPFNEELILRYRNSLEAAIKQLEGQHWHQIIVLHEMSLFTPDAERGLVQSLKARKERGLFACGVVIGDVDCKILVREQMSRCYQQCDVKHHYFDTIAGAKLWLNQFVQHAAS